MTDEAKTTWALVVGIDRYDDPSLASLDGAVADAIDAVTWLRALGVPDTQILLHAAPSDASKQSLDGLGLTYTAAREPDIWGSVYLLTKVTGGTRLFIFLSGHGLFEPTSQRLFLTQEAGVAGTYNNLGIDKYVRLLLSTGFRRSFLFMDGCQNYPYTETKRQEIEGAIYGGIVPPTGRPGNWLAAAFAAKQGQRAAEIAGRGAFLHRLLRAMNPRQPFTDAVDLDFASGCQTVDLRRVIADDVRPAVEKAAGALTPPVDQSPQLVPYGALGSDDPCPVFGLSSVEVGMISIDLAPVRAAQAVDTVDFQVQFKPWTLRLPRPRGTPLQVPITARVPVGEQAAIRCLTVAGTPWNVVHPIINVPITGNHTLHFELIEVAPPEPRSYPDQPTRASREPEHVAVKTLTLEGHQAPVLNSNDYDRIGASLGATLHPGQPTEVAPGVRLHMHETGPEFDVDPGAEAHAGRVAAVVAEVIRDVAPSDVVIATAAGATISASTARLKVLLGAGGAAALAGPLANRVPLVVQVSADESGWETVQEIPLARLESNPGVEVPPGRIQLCLDLPWGSWRKAVDARLLEDSVITVPERIGAPPLRTRLGATGWPAGYAVAGAGGEASGGGVRAGILATDLRPLGYEARDRGRWLLTASDDLAAVSHRGGWMAVLGSRPATVFPLSPIHCLAVEGIGAEAKVEPLTNVPLGEWDLLVSTGRIEDIEPDAVTQLVASAAVDEVLGLAGAYALHGRCQWDDLGSVLDELRRREWLGLDVDLLTASLAAHTGQPTDATFVEGIAARARRGEVPILRWGVALALQLSPAGEPRLQDWRATLQRIDATLSPRSVWTVWAE